MCSETAAAALRDWDRYQILRTRWPVVDMNIYWMLIPSVVHIMTRSVGNLILKLTSQLILKQLSLIRAHLIEKLHLLCTGETRSLPAQQLPPAHFLPPIPHCCVCQFRVLLRSCPQPTKHPPVRWDNLQSPNCSLLPASFTPVLPASFAAVQLYSNKFFVDPVQGQCTRIIDPMYMQIDPQGNVACMDAHDDDDAGSFHGARSCSSQCGCGCFQTQAAWPLLQQHLFACSTCFALKFYQSILCSKSPALIAVIAFEMRCMLLLISGLFIWRAFEGL